MKKADDITKIIEDNKKNMAFIIGNGINRYCNNLSWEGLLRILSKNIEGMDNVKSGISNTEFFDILVLKKLLHTNDYLKFTLKDDLKKVIKKEMQKWKTDCILKKIVLKIKGLGIPILTTNYDDKLSKSIEEEFPKKIIGIDNKGKRFSDFYPWSCYYAKDELESPTSGFGIWHINGMIKYHRSIIIGLSDYMGCVSRVRGMLKGNHMFECNDDFDGKNGGPWEGHNTWLHIVFNKSLFIFGLNLGENETFLRWLLIQRAKYSLASSEEYKGWYVHVKYFFNEKGEKEENILPPGKIFFLESVGFEILEVENYKTLYEDVWNLIE